MSNFHTYLKQTGQSQFAFSKRVDVGQGTLSDILRGHRLPSLTLAYKIFKASDGAVRMESFIEDREAGQNVSHKAIAKSSETEGATNEGASNG